MRKGCKGLSILAILVGCFLVWTMRYAKGGGLPKLSSAKPIVFDNKTKASLAEGNAEFEHNNLLLRSERIRFFSEESKVVAEENVRLTTGQICLVTHWANYYLKKKETETHRFRLGLGRHGIEGTSLSGPIERLQAKEVCVHYNGPHPAGLNVKAERGELYEDECVILRNAWVRVGPVPIFYTPYYRHDLKESTLRWKTDLSVVKRDKDFGRYCRNDVLLDFGWSVKPGFMFDGYRKRGILWGALLEYDLYDAHGKFKYGKSADQLAHAYKDTNQQTIDRTRFFLDWRHQQSFGDSVDLIGQLKWQRDSQVVKDYRPDDYDGSNQHPDNFAEVVYRGEESVTSVMTRFKPNRFQRIQERMPEFKFDYLPVRLKESPLYGQWGVGLVSLREKPLSFSTQREQEEEKNSRRVDLFAGLSMPLHVNEACTLTPVAGGRMNHYWGFQGNRSEYTRFLGQLGFDLRLRACGEYDYENDYWNIHGIRHLIQPVMQYRYLPKTAAGRGQFPAIDRQPISANPTLEEIDLLNRRDVDDLYDMHLIRLGLENYLYTNYKKSLPAQWLKLNLYQDFRLARQTGQTTLSDSFLDGEWAPSSFLSFGAYGRFDTSNKRLRELNGSVSLHENDLWKLSLSHTYTANSSNQNSASLTYKLTSRHSLSALIGFDAHKPDLMHQTYTLTTLLAQTWKVDWQFKWKKRSASDKTSGKNSWEIRIVLTVIEG